MENTTCVSCKSTLEYIAIKQSILHPDSTKIHTMVNPHLVPMTTKLTYRVLLPAYIIGH